MSTDVVQTHEDAVQLSVGDHNGHVIIRFNKQISWVVLTPDQAIALARGIKARAKAISMKVRR